MKTLLLAALPLTLWAQSININLDHLAPKAKKKTEVTLDGDVLEAAKKLAPDQTEKFKGVTRVFVRVFEFEKPGEYTEADVESIRKQATGTGWSKVVSVKEEKESTDISIFTQNGQVGGLLVISAEETELTVVHIAGAVELARLQEVVASSISFDMASIAALQGKQ